MAFAQTPRPSAPLSKVEATGKGPYSDTVSQKNIPLIGKSPMPGSAWRVIWNGLPKPRTKAVVAAAMAGLSAPAATPSPVAVSTPATMPVVVSAPPVVAAPPPAFTPAVSGMLPLPTVALYPTVNSKDPGVMGPDGVRWGLQQPSDAPWACRERRRPRAPVQDHGRLHLLARSLAAKPRRAERPAGGGLKVGVPYVLTAKQRIHAPYGCENETVATQIHDDKAMTGLHPIIALRYHKDCSLKFTVSGSDSLTVLKSPPASITLPSPKLVPAQDVDHDERIEFQLGKGGYARFYWDGALVASQMGNIGYAWATTDSYAKFGAYRAQGGGPKGPEATSPPVHDRLH